jgi:hypothetical protein
MPQFSTQIPEYRKKRSEIADWDNFKGGLNTLLKANEIDKAELAQTDNIVLIGKGIPTKRWGADLYYQAGAAGAVRGLSGYYRSDGTNELVGFTDAGYLTIKSNASYTIRSGVSWASGYAVELTQLDDSMYIVGGNREMARYSTPTLVGFPTIGIPTSVFATQISGASGQTVKSYRVTAKTNVGETLGSTAYAVSSQPQDLLSGTIRLQWSGVSTASAVLTGYAIYGRDQGNERFLGSVGASTTVFYDDGSAIPQEFTFPPTADSTGGLNAKYISRFQDRLIFAGISGEPSKVVIGGRVPLQERLDLASGGNFILIEPDSGDNITGLSTFGSRIIVFKERSIWEITLDTVEVGNFTITNPTAKLITASHGCIAPRSITAVENDIFYLTRRGVYVLGYEPNIAIDTLRTNELSAKIRPFFSGISPDQLMGATASYHDFKYIISFPGRTQTAVYDRERLSWVAPWTYDAALYHTYYDSSNNEVLLYGSDSTPYVYELSSAYGDDDGVTIQTTLRTRSEDFGDWTLFKTIKDIYTNWRNVTGSVSVSITLEDRKGNSIAARSFSIETITGNAGWGADMWGSSLWGDSEEHGGAADISDIVRWVNLNKLARRMQITVTTTSRNDNYELLGIRAEAKAAGRGIKGENWRVS